MDSSWLMCEVSAEADGAAAHDAAGAAGDASESGRSCSSTSGEAAASVRSSSSASNATLTDEEAPSATHETPVALGENLGRRIEVKWSSGRYYRGTVTEQSEDKHKICYDDGDVRWYHLPEMVMRFVDDKDEYDLVEHGEAIEDPLTA